MRRRTSRPVGVIRTNVTRPSAELGPRCDEPVGLELAHLAAGGGRVHVGEPAEVAERQRPVLVDAAQQHVPGLAR